ncbi:uncharacterized protein [Temnothorax nylanderi]|uniref:uncharacterized protein isoform X2 n=1 Tax=Temnothorax nylanderi TaxID=102681 RepID=UPI003A853B54
MNISNMKFFFVIPTFALIAICRGADESLDESKLLTKLTPIIGSQPVYSDNTHNQKDLIASASDRTFHITKGYPGSIGGYPGSIGGYPGSIGGYPGSIGGYPGGYAGGYPGGYGTGIIGSVYPGTSYRGSNLIPGGGYIGYGYAGNYPGYSGSGGYGGYGGYGGSGGYGGYRGYGGYGDYGRGYPGGYGGYDDGSLGYGRGGYGRYDGYDNYGYGNAYGTNYGTTYAARSPYAPYSYRSDSYGTSLSNPSGYRGYS